MDGMDAAAAHSATGHPPRVFVIGATNHPGEIDAAIIRRLERRVHIPLPTLPERAALLALYMWPVARLERGVDLVRVAELARGFSGSDLTSALKHAVGAPKRRKEAALRAQYPQNTAAHRAAIGDALHAAAAEVNATPISQADLEAGVAACRATATPAVLAEIRAFQW
jgi:SpoVK/Ycf46/Vps4 family AAA+-type ATPase